MGKRCALVDEDFRKSAYYNYERALAFATGDGEDGLMDCTGEAGKRLLATTAGVLAGVGVRRGLSPRFGRPT